MKRKLSAEEIEIRKSRLIGSAIVLVAVILFVIYFLFKDNAHSQILLYTAIALVLTGVLFVLPINYYIFDICDWEERDNMRSFIKKLRLRSIVFTNLSYLILIVSILVIIFCSYQLTNPNMEALNKQDDQSKLNYVVLVSQVGSAVILIFLVQILFRVFKYLIRVGGFYNGKADALELTLLDKGKTYTDPYKTLEAFTPNNYDMSDVESPNLVPSKL
ncbi:MAG: hypothetical protein JST63_15360 [Bacteroidetes bacterium]|nr:hypothetical protein [Bacteroidota bacterium]